jgi:hypothetical protein
MKTYKIKSLFYFSGFLLAAILYYGIEQQQELNEQLQTNQMVDMTIEDEEEATKEEVKENP